MSKQGFCIWVYQGEEYHYFDCSCGHSAYYPHNTLKEIMKEVKTCPTTCSVDIDNYDPNWVWAGCNRPVKFILAEGTNIQD